MIYYASRVLDAGGTKVLAVIIPGSAERPHFAGPSYIREGPTSKVASTKQLEELIAERSAKSYEIIKWKDKVVSVHEMVETERAHRRTRVLHTTEDAVLSCNRFYVTLERNKGDRRSIPLSRVEFSFDHDCGRLKLEVRPL